jgi:hypothetical protein
MFIVKGIYQLDSSGRWSMHVKSKKIRKGNMGYITVGKEIRLATQHQGQSQAQQNLPNAFLVLEEIAHTCRP